MLKVKCKDVYCFIILFVFFFFVSVFALHKTIGLSVYHSLTRSAPRGVYVGSRLGLDDLHINDYVIARQPFAVGRLEKGHLLLKMVKALPGEEYVVTEDYVELHGQRYVMNREYSKYGIPFIPPGRYVLDDESYFLLNLPPTSFDSRSLGPFRKDLLVAKARMLINYETLLQNWVSLERWWNRDGT